MQNIGLDEAKAGVKSAGRNINNLRYADDTCGSLDGRGVWGKIVVVQSLSHVQLFATP